MCLDARLATGYSSESWTPNQRMEFETSPDVSFLAPYFETWTNDTNNETQQHGLK